MRQVSVTLLLLCVCSFLATAEETTQVNCLGQKEVSVSSKPDATSTVATLRCGERILVLQEANGWAKIRAANGVEGYLAEPFIARLEASRQVGNIGSQGVKCYPGITSLPAFSAPNPPWTGVADLPCGEEIAVLEQLGDWTKVRLSSGTVAYVSSAYLATKEELLLQQGTEAEQVRQAQQPSVDASGHREVVAEVINSNVGARAIYWTMPGTAATANTFCTGGDYSATCNTTINPGTPPTTYSYAIPQVWVQAIVDGRHATLWCQKGLRDCRTLAPGKYRATLDGDTVWVTGTDFSGKKERRIKYKFVGSW